MKFGARKYGKVWLSVFFLGFVGLLALAYLGYRYRGHVSSAFGWISEETGGKKMAVLTIALTLCGLIYGFFCLISPIIVVLELRDLRHRTTEIERIVQTFARVVSRQANDGPMTPEAEEKSSK